MKRCMLADLQAFKELLAATKSLLAEHPRTAYQVGRLSSVAVNESIQAVQIPAFYLNDHMPQIQVPCV